MFKLRLLGRSGRTPGDRLVRGSRSRPPSDAAAAASAEASRLAWSDKGLLAAALAQPPAWTNALPAADARARGGNVRARAALPAVTPFAMNTGQAATDGAMPGATTGGQSWHSSTDPR